jgi:transposase
MRRHELSDPQWQQIAALFPTNGSKGGQWKNHRHIRNGMLWRLYTGAPWRDMPERYGPWQTIDARCNRYSKDGTFDRIVERLPCPLETQGRIDWDLWGVDGRVMRARRAAAGAGKKGDRKNPPLMPEAAPVVGVAPKFPWSLRAMVCPSPFTLRLGSVTTRRRLRSSSMLCVSHNHWDVLGHVQNGWLGTRGTVMNGCANGADGTASGL